MQQTSGTSFLLVWATRVGIWLALCTPLVVAPNLFFPYITGKNFFFRIVTELTFGIWLTLVAVDTSRFLPRRGIILWAISAFVGIFGLAALVGMDPYASFWSNFERMEGVVTYLHIFMLFLMASSVFRDVSEWRLTFHVAFAVSVIIALYGLLELLGVVVVPGSTAAQSGIGIFSRLGNQIYLAQYLLFHFFILGFLFFTTKNMWWRIVYSAAAIFEFYIFLSTGTRGALIGFLLGVFSLIAVFLLFSFRQKKRVAAFAGIALLLVAAFCVSVYTLRDSGFVKSRPLLLRLSSIQTTSPTAQSRFMIWGIAKDAFRERPLLGWGPGNFIIPYAKHYNPNLFGNEPWFDRVHNMHFEWLVAGGIVGFAAYMVLILSSVIVLWRLWYRNHLEAISVSFLGGLLVAYLVQNTFVFDTVITYMYFALFLALLHSMDAVPEASAGKNQYRQSPFKKLAPIFLVLGIVAVFTIHPKQMAVAKGIISMLNNAAQGRTAVDIIREMKEMEAKKTFGTTEARERFVDMLFAAANQPKNVSPADLVLLLTHGIQIMTDEVARSPQNVKNDISLAKLLQLRFSATGNKQDYEEAIKIYERAIENGPLYPSSHIGLAEVYLTAGNAAKAAEIMDAMFRKMTRPNAFIYPTLTVSILNNDFARAASQVDYFMGLGNTPTYPRSAYLEDEKIQAVIDRAIGKETDIPGREKFYETILRYQESPRSLFLALAFTKAQLGKFDEARKIANDLVRRDQSFEKEVAEFLQQLDAVAPAS